MAAVEDRAERGADEVVLPAHLSVECPRCGHTSTSLALHTGHVSRARTCPTCEGPTQVVAHKVAGAGCACCW